MEEVLVPNSYRVRWLGDLDGGYDYRLDADVRPAGDCDAGLVVERIEPPSWSLHRTAVAITVGHAAEMGRPPLDTPDFAFEPARTRVEGDAKPVISRVLILKLDHLGDFIMSLPVLERASPVRRCDDRPGRGSWNSEMARELGLADRVIAFDAFSSNSSERESDVHATLDVFRTLVIDD